MAEVEGTEVVAKNIVLFKKGFLREINADFEQVRDMVHKQVDANISLSDHSLADLARLGHPYSKRSPKALHNPDFQVHEQTGRLRAGLFSTTEPADVSLGRLTAAAIVGIKDGIEHAAYVIRGTSKMVPRDFLGGSVHQLRDKILNTLKRSLKNTVVNFRGVSQKL